MHKGCAIPRLTTVRSVGLGLLFVLSLMLPAMGQIELPAGGYINSVAGNNTMGYSGDGGLATSAELNDPGYGVAVDASGNIYIADSANYRIRKVAASTGIITTVAGTGTEGYSGDGGPAVNAEIGTPFGIAVDSSGDIYFADYSNFRVREVNTSGVISTVAGTGTNGHTGDGGPATSADLDGPVGVAVDRNGNVYISELGGNTIREVDPLSQTITTIAGSSPTCGESGNGGAAASSLLCDPAGLAVDTSNNLYIADQANNCIREISASTRIINVVAGTCWNGESYGGYWGDGGPATMSYATSDINQPYGVAVDNQGNIYIADFDNNRIRKVTYSTGDISTVAGNGTRGFSGNGGLATSAEIDWPTDVAVDASGNLYFTGYVAEVRAVGGSQPTTTSVDSSNSSVYDGATVAFTATVTAASGTPTGTVTFYANGNSIGSASLSDGSASLSTNSLAIGSYSITASYAGNSPYVASTSAAIPQTITTVPTGIAVSMPNSASYGSTVTMGITVTASNGGTPTGTVTVVADGSTGLCTVSLSGGSGTCSENTLHPGTHSISFSYGGTSEYASASVTEPLTISVITPTITWSQPAAITYGTALSSTQLDATETPSTAGTWSYTPSAGAVLGAGSQTLSVTFTPSDTTDYSSASASTTITINKATPSVSVSCSPDPIVYGGGNTTCTASVGGGATGNVAFYANGGGWTTVPLSGSTASAAGWGGGSWSAGTYSVGATYNGDSNNNAVSASTSITISKATPSISVSCSPNPITYGLQTTNCTSSISGGTTGTETWTINGGAWTSTGLNGSAGGFAGYSAGSYTIGVSYPGDGNNNAASANTTVTINPTPTVTQVSSSLPTSTYGQTVTLTSLVNTGGGTPTGTVSFNSGGTEIGASSISTVSTTNLVPYSSQVGNGATWSGYCETSATQVYDSPAVAAPDGTQTATMYTMPNTPPPCSGGGNHGAISSIAGGLTVGQVYTVSVWLRGAVGGETVNIGLNDGYMVGETLTTAWQRFTYTSPSYTSVSGEDNRGFQIIGEQANETFYAWGAQTEAANSVGPYIATGSSSAAGYGGLASYETSSLPVGSDSINAVYSGDANDVSSTSAALSQTINAIAQTIAFTPPPSPVTYGVAPITLSATGGGSGNPVVFSVVSGPGTVSGSRLTITGTGTVIVAANQAGSATYAAAPQVTQSVVVNQAPLTITPTSESKTYGSVYALTAYTVAGLQNSDTVTGVTLASSGTVATAAVGSYAITASAATGSGLSNYSITYATGSTLTVSAAVLTITPTSESKTYGSTYTLTAYTATGLQNSDTVTGVTLASSGTVATATVGSYAITASAATGSGLSNYSITYATGSTLAVNAAPLVITPTSESKTYGSVYTLTAYTVAGLQNSDTVTGVTLASSGTVATATVGSYAIMASAATGSALGNYSITYATGSTLTVSAAPLTITPTSESKTYGSLYTLTAYTVTGLQNSDAVTGVTLTSSGTVATATVGSYAITASAATGSALDNYSITYATGSTLTVNAAPLVVTPLPQTKAYGTTLVIPNTAFTAVGLLNTDTVSSVVMVSPGTDPSATVAGGPYSIVASGATGSGLSNYSITYNTGPLTVDKVGVVIVGVSSLHPSTYGDGVLFTFTVTGAEATPTGSLTLSDGSTVLGTINLTNGVGTYSSAALSAGTHNVTAAYSGDSNYY